jgi:hypothetical protein
MRREKWALAACVVFSSLWSGLLAMLTLIMHPMLAAMDGRDFARFRGVFLPVARRSWFNYVCVFGLLLAPIAALITLAGDPGSAPFVLTAIGLVLTIAGPLLVSNRLAEPNYDVMLAWDPDAVPADWEATRRALLRTQLDPGCGDLDGVHAVSRGARGPVVGPLSRCRT